MDMLVLPLITDLGVERPLSFVWFLHYYKLLHPLKTSILYKSLYVFEDNICPII